MDLGLKEPKGGDGNEYVWLRYVGRGYRPMYSLGFYKSNNNLKYTTYRLCIFLFLLQS